MIEKVAFTDEATFNMGKWKNILVEDIPTAGVYIVTIPMPEFW